MTVPIPHTWVDGEFATASANLNPGIRDVLAFLLDPPRVALRQITTGQSIPNNVYTALTFNFEDYDNEPSGMHDPGTNPSRMTCRTPGSYQLSGSCSFATNGTGRRGLVWYVNGVALPASQTILGATSTSGFDIPAKTIFTPLAVGDYVELRVFQDSGAAMTLVVTSPSQSAANARWSGP